MPLGKSTHIEIRDVGGTFFISFNGVVQCVRFFFFGHVLHAHTDRDVYVNDPWHTASDVTLSFHRVHGAIALAQALDPRERKVLGCERRSKLRERLLDVWNVDTARLCACARRGK